MYCLCIVARVITAEQGKRLADSWNALFVESSAKQNEVRISSYTSTLHRNTFKQMMQFLSEGK